MADSRNSSIYRDWWGTPTSTYPQNPNSRASLSGNIGYYDNTSTDFEELYEQHMRSIRDRFTQSQAQAGHHPIPINDDAITDGVNENVPSNLTIDKLKKEIQELKNDVKYLRSKVEELEQWKTL